MSHKILKSNYKNLIGNISQIYEKTQQILVEANWHIGKQIVEDEQLNSDRAEYGTALIAQLSADLTEKYGVGFSARNLRNMRQFYLTYRIWQSIAKLDWTKYIALISIKNDEVRKEIEGRAINENLTVQEVLKIVKQTKQNIKFNNKKTSKETATILKFTRGTLGEYRLLLKQTKNRIDCGFNIIREVPKRASSKPTENPSYTYIAFVDRVVDGDTLLATIDCGFGTQIKQRLRLRGIDTPELKTKEGDRAKWFVQRVLKGCDFVVIRSHRTDKYARYIADIFYLPGEDNAKVVAREGLFLNQELLNRGMAVIF